MLKTFFLLLTTLTLFVPTLYAQGLEGLIKELESQLIPLESIQENSGQNSISSSTTVLGKDPNLELFNSLEQQLDRIEGELQNIESQIAKEQLSMQISAKKQSHIDIQVVLPIGISYRDVAISINGQRIVSIPSITTKANFYNIPVYKGYLLPGTYRVKISALAHHPTLIQTKPMNLHFTETMKIDKQSKTSLWTLKLKEDKGRFYLAGSTPKNQKM